MQATTPTLRMPSSDFADAEFANHALTGAGSLHARSASPGLLGKPAGELVLRICGGEHDGRVLRIQSAKCVIGSAAGCTLRLRARHIRPVHVLILRGPQGSAVRCWSPDVLLNERAFEETHLNVGDILQIGPIKLHVAELNQRLLVNDSTLQAPPATPAVIAAPIPTSAARKPRLSRRRKQLINVLRQERKQQGELRETINKQRSQLDSLQEQLRNLPAVVETPPVDTALNEQLRRTIDQLQQELTAAAKRRSVEQQSSARQRLQLDEQLQQRLQAERDRIREQLQTQHEQELARLTEEFNQRADSQLLNERLVATHTIGQLRSELTATTEERQTLAREIDSLKLALQTKASSEDLSRQSAATQIEQLSQAFELVREERDELFQRLQDEQQVFDEQMTRWQAQIDEARAAAHSQVNLGEAAAQKQLAIVRSELATRNAQLTEAQQQARSRETQLLEEHRRHIAELRAQLLSRTEAEEQRRAADMQRIAQLTATIESLRGEATADASARQQQQEGWTQARKRLEAEVSALNARLHQSDEALHEVRQNSGLVQAQVLAEAEQARAERDAVREQMLRQQQEWTDFRCRLEASVSEERDLAAARQEKLHAELASRVVQCESLQNELRISIQARQEAADELALFTEEWEQLLSKQEAGQRLVADLQGEITELRTSILQLQGELNGRSQQCDDLHSDLRAANQARQETASELALINEQREQLRGEHERLFGDHETAQRQMEELHGEITDLRATVLQLQSELSDRGLTCEELQSQLQAANQAWQEAVNELTLVSDERASLRGEQEFAQQQAVELNLELADLRITIGQLHEEVNGRGRKCEELQSQLHAEVLARQEVANELTRVLDEREVLRVEEDFLQLQIADLNGEMTDLRTKNFQWQEEVAGRVLECEGLQSELQAANQAWQEAVNELTLVADDRDLQRGQHAVAQQQLADQSVEISDLRITIGNLQDEVACRGQQCERLQSELQAASQAHQDATNALSRLSEERDVLRGEHEFVQRQVADLIEEIADLQKTNETLRGELEAASLSQQSVANELALVVGAREHLRVAVEFMHQQVSDLNGEVTDLRTAMLQLQAEVAKRGLACEELQCDLESTKQTQQETATELALVTDEYEQLRERLSSEQAASQQQVAERQTEIEMLRGTIAQLQLEIEAAVAARDVAEQATSGRLQQMTISMEQLELDRHGSLSEVEQERNAWHQEREEFAQTVAELQREIARITELLTAQEDQVRQSTAESRQRTETAEQQLQAAQDQVAQWQAAAQQAKDQCAELSQAVARLRQQEQIWQLEREQLDFSQQTSNERLQQLEASITGLQQQLIHAQDSVAGNQQTADQENIAGTISVNNQELASLHEQMAATLPSLLAPRDVPSSADAGLQVRAAELSEKAEALAQQQAQLEEQQATVARQRIELEQFHASLREMEEMLERRAEELLRRSNPPQPIATSEPEHTSEVDRDSHPLSESEAFAAMADQVANLYRTPPPTANPNRISQANSSPADDPYARRGGISSPAEAAEDPVQPEPESLVISSPDQTDASRDLVSTADSGQLNASEDPLRLPPTLLAPGGAEDFEAELDARIARVMGSESVSWTSTMAELAATSPSPTILTPSIGENSPVAEQPPASSAVAVNNVLERLREAGLWKGEGTAKVDQLPSSDPPVEGGTALCRASELGPIVGDPEPITASPDETAEPEDNLATLASPQAPATHLQSPPSAESEADDSIESYMSRLMQRLRSDSDSGPAESLRTSSSRGANRASVPPTSYSSMPTSPVVRATPPKPVDVTPLTSLSDLTPRSPAPEAGSNLAAMRELANSAARGAIESHQIRSGKQRVTARSINTLLALLVASGLVFWWSRSGSTLALGGAGLSVMWALTSSLLAGWQSAALRKSQLTADGPKRPAA